MRKLKSITPLPAPRSLLPLTLMAMLNCAEPTPPPAFELSGVIEGFYGPPWSHSDRLDMLRFMGGAGLKVYIYAPKNDPYHRARWREPYPEDAERQLRELVQTADAAGVEFWYSIHPGLTITYSDSLDYQELLRKIDRVATLGVEHFGLFVDDVPTELAHAADRVAYRTLAGAHVDLTNRLYTYLAERGHTLALTPTIYTNAWGDLDYLAEIGAGVAPEVMILWTGPDVTSSIITKAQAFDWGALLQRKPLLWDNYPVNDYARWRLFLGPVTGRAPDLAETTLGIIANPMNEAHASMISLATLGEYARDPAAYDPDRSLGAALETLYGADVGAVLPFVDVFGDYGWDNNVFEPLYILADTIPVSAMERVLAQLRSDLSELRRRADSSTALWSLYDEIAPFISHTSDRIAALRRTGFYDERDGAFIYRRELDRVSTQHTSAPVRIDGDLTEWQDADWRQLHRNGVSGDNRVAFRRDGEFLYVAVEVRNRNIRAQAGRRVGQADHIAIVIDTDPSDGRIGSDDLFILLPPPHATADTDPTVVSLPFQGHMAKWLADNRALTFTEFHLSTFATEPSPAAAPFAAGLQYAANRTRTGYTAVLALPHLGRDRLHVSLTVTTTSGGKRVSSLSRRNYPANPTTFAEIRLNH